MRSAYKVVSVALVSVSSLETLVTPVTICRYVFGYVFFKYNVHVEETM